MVRVHLLSFTTVAVCVVAALLPLGAGASPESIPAAADAYVQATKMDTNFGSATTLAMDTSPLKRAYLRFNVAAGDPVARATLSLYVKRSQQPFDVRLVSGVWGEASITYRLAPTFGPVAVSSGPVARDAWVDIDVTTLVVAGLALDLALTVSSGEQIIASRETAKGPKLLVERTTSSTTTSSTTTSSTTTSSTTSSTTTSSTTTTTTMPPPQPHITGGIWISQSELTELPTFGPAWDSVVSAANSAWGSADLTDNNSDHDIMVLAGALVAARTDDAAMRSKVISGIHSLEDSGFARVLEMARNLPGYVIAADVINLLEVDPSTDGWFRGFVADLRTKPLEGHGGGQSLRETAMFSTNNWGSRARAAMVAIDLYLGETADLEEIVIAERGYLGEAVNHQLNFTDTDWHADPGSRAGVNRRGATIQEHDVDGVIPEDQRRTGAFKWPAQAGDYPWGALQGESMACAMLYRAGLMSFRAGDDALARAAGWLFNVNSNPPSGDDTPTTWIINRYAGTTFPTTAAANGKGIAWTDWTHATSISEPA